MDEVRDVMRLYHYSIHTERLLAAFSYTDHTDWYDEQMAERTGVGVCKRTVGEYLPASGGFI